MKISSVDYVIYVVLAVVGSNYLMAQRMYTYEAIISNVHKNRSVYINSTDKGVKIPLFILY